MIASLPMYEREETREALATLWTPIRSYLREHDIDAPEQLTPNADTLDFWCDENLVLSQTCGLPFRTTLHDKVKLVGTPNLQQEGCEPGYYRSAIVVRADDDRSELKDFSNAKVTCNEVTSQSGYAALKQHWEDAQLSWPEAIYFSGSHRESAMSVAGGVSDIAALDVLSFSLMRRHDEFTQNLRVLEWTQPTPTLPFICAGKFDATIIANAIQHGIESLEHQVKSQLGLFGITPIPEEAYHQVPTPDESRAAFS